jgi:hypothetical protein
MITNAGDNYQPTPHQDHGPQETCSPCPTCGSHYKPLPPLQPETSALLNGSLRIEEDLPHLKCARGGGVMNTSEFPSPREPQEVEPVVAFLTALSALPPETLISESQLAQMAGRHVTSLKRAIQRGELPPPVPFLGENVWTVGAIRAHISARLEAERTAAAQTARRVQHLRPGQGGRN